jgi:hypothetical protein
MVCIYMNVTNKPTSKSDIEYRSSAQTVLHITHCTFDFVRSMSMVRFDVAKAVAGLKKYHAWRVTIQPKPKHLLIHV